MSNNSFSIQFIRNVNSKNLDDNAIIKSAGVDNFTVIYNDATTGTPMSFSANSNGVFRWVRRVLRLLEEDADPFQCIQLNIHAMPSVMFNVAELNNKYETILDAVEYYIDVISQSSPSTPESKHSSVHRECPSAPVRRHLFFDEDGEEYEHGQLRYYENDFVY